MSGIGRFSRKLASLGAIFGLVLLLAFPAFAQARHVVLLGLNDYHAVFRPGSDGAGGLPKAAWLVKEVKETYASSEDVAVLALEMGDAFSQIPSQAREYGGEPEYRGLTLASFDVGIPGNHEFDNGSEFFASALGFAGFPLICSNLKEGSAPSLEPLMGKNWMIDAGGVKIGLFSLLTNEYSGRSFADPDFAGIARSMVAELKDNGCSVIVAMTHIGLGADLDLASEVEGIDVILGGHSHDITDAPLFVNQTLVTQAGAFCRFMGRVDLSLDENGLVTNREWELIPLGPEMPEDPTVKAFLDPFSADYPDPEDEAAAGGSGGGGGGCSGPGTGLPLFLLLPLAWFHGKQASR